MKSNNTCTCLATFEDSKQPTGHIFLNSCGSCLPKKGVWIPILALFWGRKWCLMILPSRCRYQMGDELYNRTCWYIPQTWLRLLFDSTSLARSETGMRRSRLLPSIGPERETRFSLGLWGEAIALSLWVRFEGTGHPRPERTSCQTI